MNPSGSDVAAVFAFPLKGSFMLERKGHHFQMDS